MPDAAANTLPHAAGSASDWVQRWTHLLPAGATVLDVACGHGRHMKWFAQNGHQVTGLDQSVAAIEAAGAFGQAVLADIEHNSWPLIENGQIRQFDAIVVTNYLWRPLFPIILQSLASGSVLIYETFAQGNETVGKPSRPAFLLQPGELLRAFKELHVIAFEDGFLENPPRFVQRMAAVRVDPETAPSQVARRHVLGFEQSR